MELLKAIGTAWSFWTAVVAVLFLVLFRDNIRGLISRITSIDRGGITAVAATASKDAQAKQPPDPRAEADKLLAALDNEYVRVQEDVIRAELEKRGLAANPNEAIRVLTRYLAVAGMAVDFERTDALIYESQLRILEHLNTMSPANRDSLRPYYDQGATQSPLAYAIYPFDNYMNFLVQSALVLRQDDSYSLTVKGRTYLMWRVHEGKPRPLLA